MVIMPQQVRGRDERGRADSMAVPEALLLGLGRGCTYQRGSWPRAWPIPTVWVGASCRQGAKEWHCGPHVWWCCRELARVGASGFGVGLFLATSP